MIWRGISKMEVKSITRKLNNEKYTEIIDEQINTYVIRNEYIFQRSKRTLQIKEFVLE